MLTILGRAVRLCDGISRRSFLTLGSLGLAGLSLPELLRARQTRPSRRAVILYWMAGGPSHVDTYDMKPDAPEQVRGPFKPGRTRVPGMQFSELFAQQAAVADKLSIVRGLTHTNFDHFDAAHWVQTGYHEFRVMGRGQPYPSQGSVVSMLRGPNERDMPPYVCIPEAWSARRGFYQHAAFLGAAHDPLSAGGAGLSERYAHNRPQLEMPAELTVRRIEDRRELRRRLQARAEEMSAVRDMDRHYQRAFELVTGPRVRAAFDLQREPPPLQERYGRNPWGQAALLARRLVEAGVTFVTINHFEAEVDWWDDHYTIEANLKRRLPVYDRAIGALIADLHDRGMADDVLVAAFGEFGRSPVNDKQGGRGHWARAWHALLSGGGIKGGRVVGATTRDGGEPKGHGFSPGDLLATIYRCLEIDPDQTVLDRQKRPVHIVDQGKPIRELF
jgi:hypothetical protein